MCKGIVINFGKNFSETLSKAECIAAKENSLNGTIGKNSAKLERSPKEDKFFKGANEPISQSSVTSLIDKEKSVIPLNKEGTYSQFFGVTSDDDIQDMIYNQMALTTLKMEEHNITDFTGIMLDYGYPYTCNVKSLESSIKNLFETGAGRLTMRGKVFGSESSAHTVGLVFDKKSNILYVLDSLPKEVQSLYRDSLVKALTLEEQNGTCGIIKPKQYNGKDIHLVFSGKPQQQINEYTCNNWSLANIEALQSSITDGKVLSEEELNAVLPDNINEILKSQMEYLTKEHKSLYSEFLKSCGL